MTKPTIKLRPKTRPAVSAELSDALENFSEQATVPAAITRAELERLSALPDNDYYRAKKKQISIRMDADILAWFQAQPGKYQQLINKACRVYRRLSELVDS